MYTKQRLKEGDNRSYDGWKRQLCFENYAMPQSLGITLSIVNLTVKAQDFKLRPSFISLVEKEFSSVGKYLRTHTCICIIFLRNAIPSNSMGYPPMLFDCGFSLSY